ncbi:MAG: cell division protein FtsH, partial [Gemmatimonadetes bacterium]|nr:cell division protein FtsH [Gemmatimonadota bacterium]
MPLLYVFFLVALWLVVGTFVTGGSATDSVTYSRFRADLEAGRVTEVMLAPDRITYSVAADVPTEPGAATPRYQTIRTEDDGLVERLIDAGVEFEAEKPAPGFLGPLTTLGIMLIPLFLVWFLVLRAMGGGRNSPMSIGKSRAKEITAETITQTFEDAGGVDAVEEELKEVIDFLKHPDRYKAMGARLPTGILLVGPPGTGKTLLAKA